MNEIIYKVGNVIDQDIGDGVLTHACNTQGVWGSGFAKQLADKYPEACDTYRIYCEGQLRMSMDITGQALIVMTQKPWIGCLFTSARYGKQKDDPYTIFDNTISSSLHLISMLEEDSVIHSPMINSGLFAVPWEDTEKAIKSALLKCDKTITWVVWKLS